MNTKGTKSINRSMQILLIVAGFLMMLGLFAILGTDRVLAADGDGDPMTDWVVTKPAVAGNTKPDGYGIMHRYLVDSKGQAAVDCTVEFVLPFTFSKDKQWKSMTFEKLPEGSGEISGDKNRSSSGSLPWEAKNPPIVTFGSGISITGDATKMFAELGDSGYGLDLTNVDLSGVDNASSMFDSFDGSSIKFGNYTMDKLTDCSRMFRSCRYLTELTLPSSMTLNAKGPALSLGAMFANCDNLKHIYNLDKLKISYGDTDPTNVPLNMSTMFKSCPKLEEIDLSGLVIPVGAVLEAGSSTFESCPKVRKMKLPANFYLSNMRISTTTYIWWSENDQKYYTDDEITKNRPNGKACPADTFTTDLSKALATDSRMTVEISDVEYSGANATPPTTLTVGNKTIDSSHYSVASTSKNVTNGATASATITGNGSPYYGSFTKTNAFSITKKTPTADDFTFTAPTDLVYNGTKKAATLTPTNGQSFGAITYHYYDSKGQPVEEVKNAGTYTVKIDVAESANNSAVSGLTSDAWIFTIAKADPVVTAPKAINDLIYNGGVQTLTDTGSTSGGTLKYAHEGTALSDYSSSPVKGVDAGDYNVYYYVQGNENYNSTTPVQVPDVKIAPRSITASGVTAKIDINSDLTYTGDEIKPTTIIMDGSTGLVEGTKDQEDKDYYLTYTDNKDAKQKSGKDAVITVHGMRNYTGTRTLNFTISPKEISSLDVLAEPIDPQTYTGGDIKPTLRLYDTARAKSDTEKTYLEEGEAGASGTNVKDFSVNYKNNVNVSGSTTKKINVSGTGNYTGAREESFEITKADPKASDFLFAPPDDAIYSGTAKEATFNTSKTGMGTVTPVYYKGDTKLDAAPVDAGDYTVKLNVAEGSNYNAATELSADNWSFSILRKSINEVTPPLTSDITATINVGQDLTYTGKEICPIVTVKDGMKTMEMATDEKNLNDYTVAYSLNIDSYSKQKNKSEITITGQGNYQGSRTLTFEIAQKSIKDESIAILDVDPQPYTGSKIEPELTIYDGARKYTEETKDRGTLLVQKKDGVTDYDYSLSYGDDDEDINVKGDNKVYVKGEGNYTDVTEKSFTITPIAPEASDFDYEEPTDLVYDGKAKEPTFTTSTTGMGKPDPVYYKKVVTTDEETGEEITEEQKLDSAPIEVGTYIVRLNVAEGDNYTAATELSDDSWTFTITPKDIGSEDITVTGLQDRTYDGEAQTQEPTVTDKRRTDETSKGVMVESEDYTFTYSDNTNAGTATITFTGEGNYTGTKTETFTIEPRSVADATIHLGKLLIANGEEQTQDIESVTVEGAKETLDVTYDVDGNKATDPGKHELTITGNGNFKGEKVHSWTIVPTTDEAIEKLKWKILLKTNCGMNAPLVKIDTGLADMVRAVATADEMAAVSDGGELDIILQSTDLNNTVDPAVRSKLEQLAQTSKGAKIGDVFDLQILKQLKLAEDADTTENDEELVAVTETNGPITLTIKIPQNLINTNKTIKRTYFVLRNHNDVVSVLDSKYDANAQTLTISSDGFSEYAIAYKDEAIPQKKAPKTGDENQLALWLGMMAMAMAGLGGTAAQRKRR